MFLEFASPNIEEGITNCVKKGATEVHVIPIILLHAGHSKLHIPAEIEHAREHYPNITFTYGQTIGIHEEIFAILEDRLVEIGFNAEEQHEDTAILLIARGGSDPAANGDFIKLHVCYGKNSRLSMWKVPLWVSLIRVLKKELSAV